MPPWTYSHLDKFESCPKQFYELKVVKNFEDPPTEQKLWGDEVHRHMQCAVDNKAELPTGMSQWQSLVNKICAMPGTKFTEYKMSLDASFNPAPWDDCWSRGIADVVVLGKSTAAVLDYKTGKYKPSEQLKLYAGYVFSHHSQIQRIETGYLWLKERKITKESISRAEMPHVWQGLVQRAAKLRSAYERNVWPPRPSGLCRGWCPVTTCKYNIKRA
jgi:hypothetical protein